MSAASAPSSSTHAGAALRWLGVIGIVTIAVMRLLIVFAPELHFDVDPAFDPHPMAGVSPAGSLLLDVLLLICCAAALTGEWLSRRGIEWKLILLALLPVPIVILHGQMDFLHLWRGMTWQAAFIACAVIAHLARDRSMRVIIVAILIAALAPLIVRGASQVTVEHAQTIAFFEDHREQFLRERGWEPGSANALIYERRLRQPQPLGWFATTNIFASALLPLLALGAGFALALRRSSLPSGWTGLLIVIALIALIGIWLSGSKGALLIALLTIALALMPFLIARRTLASSPPAKPPLARFAPAILLALPFAALAGVLLRGFLPETFLGDRSLLFRWHYLVSSAGIFAESPFTGVGPDGYQEAYMRHRLPRNPEEVVTSHSMFIDWLCMLGVLAIAWCGMVFAMLLRAGGRLLDTPEFIDGLDIESVLRRLARIVALLLLIAFIPAIMAELHVLDVYDLTVRIIGAVAFVGLALAAASIMLNVDRPIMNWLLAIGAAAIVMHGQIEMSFFQGGFIVWGLCLIGAVGGAAVSTTPRIVIARWPAVWPLIIILLAVWTAFSAVLPAMQQTREMRATAAMLYPLADDPHEAVAQRRRASERLLAAYEILPRNRLPLIYAVTQLERAATAVGVRTDERIALLLEAMERADRAVAEHPLISSFGMRYRIAAVLAIVADEEPVKQAALKQAIDDARIITERDPHGITGWRRLGDMLWLAERREEAAIAYRRALEADANFELDPLKQLSEQDRQQLQERVMQIDGQ